MSTRSSIILKLREEDKGRTLKIEKTKAPYFGASDDVLNSFHDVEISRDTKYIGAYCHFDGYPSGVGAKLKNYFDTYERALNLILGGDMSSMPMSGLSYYVLRDDDQIVHQISEPCSVFDSCDYLYVFEEGRWIYYERKYDKEKNLFYYDFNSPVEL